MGRWLLLAGALSFLGTLTLGDIHRAPDAKPLGSACESTHDCRKGTTCVEVDGVMNAQCSSACSSSTACQQEFGGDALCLGADLCARTCQGDHQCPASTACNAYGWCERTARD